MSEFLDNWAQRLLNVFRACEADPLFGRPCTRCSKTTPSADTSPVALYGCTSCFNAPPLCQACMVAGHVWNPFHRITFWNGSYSESSSLAELGLIVRLGHHGLPCPSVDPMTEGYKVCTIVHTNGIHTAHIQYCRCSKESNPFPEKPLQLWNAGLWPATYKRTQTAFTLHVLKHYDRLTLQAKTTALDFVGTLRRLTNHAFAYDVKVLDISTFQPSTAPPIPSSHVNRVDIANS